MSKLSIEERRKIMRAASDKLNTARRGYGYKSTEERERRCVDALEEWASKTMKHGSGQLIMSEERMSISMPKDRARIINEMSIRRRYETVIDSGVRVTMPDGLVTHDEYKLLRSEWRRADARRMFGEATVRRRAEREAALKRRPQPNPVALPPIQRLTVPSLCERAERAISAGDMESADEVWREMMRRKPVPVTPEWRRAMKTFDY